MQFPNSFRCYFSFRRCHRLAMQSLALVLSVCVMTAGCSLSAGDDTGTDQGAFHAALIQRLEQQQHAHFRDRIPEILEAIVKDIRWVFSEDSGEGFAKFTAMECVNALRHNCIEDAQDPTYASPLCDVDLLEYCADGGPYWADLSARRPNLATLYEELDLQYGRELLIDSMLNPLRERGHDELADALERATASPEGGTSIAMPGYVASTQYPYNVGQNASQGGGINPLIIIVAVVAVLAAIFAVVTASNRTVNTEFNSSVVANPNPPVYIPPTPGLFPPHLFPQSLSNAVGNYAAQYYAVQQAGGEASFDHNAQLAAIQAQLDQSFGIHNPDLYGLYSQVFFDAEYSFDLNAYVAEQGMGLQVLSNELANLAIYESIALHPGLQSYLVHLAKRTPLSRLGEMAKKGKAPRPIERIEKDTSGAEGGWHVHYGDGTAEKILENGSFAPSHKGNGDGSKNRTNRVQKWFRGHGYG